MRIFISFLVLLAFSVVAVAADRQIGYVQQEKPGELVIVSVVQTGKKNAALIHDFRKGAGEKMRPIAKEEFELLWSAFTGPEASSFVFEPGNMSDVGYYTVKILGGKKEISLRIPRDKKPEAISAAIAKIQSWIDEKG